ncbi:MAG TPA: CoA transferase [Candidatus Dormibacteraeota bacterium]|nr:CoA transferase [Candidatus Dormibacteraeota bacterium]
MRIGMTMKNRDALSGMRVLEFGHIVSGPFATLLLADLGADVVKVEPPQGDGLRAWPPIVEGDNGARMSLNFAALNRNKRSIIADLKDSEQRGRVLRLCASADVIVENYRPGTLARLGIGFIHVSAMNERIVYCSLSGYGQTGPYKSRGAFDVVVQAISGLMNVTGEENGPPAKSGVPVADFVAGLYAAYSILAARDVAAREHRPINLDCSMLDCILGISGLQTSEYWGTGIPPKRMGSAHPHNAPYQAYDALDGPFVIAAGNDNLWAEVSAAVDRHDLTEDPRFKTIGERARNQKALAELLQPIFKTRTVREWLTEFESRGVPCAPVNSHAQILSDEHVIGRGLVQNLPLPIGGSTRTIPFPVLFDGSRLGVYAPPPLLGEHTEEVFAEWSAPVRPDSGRAT